MAAPQWVRASLTIVAGMTCSHAAHSMWATPSDAPVDRLIANFEQYTREHPDDPEGFYRLGRVHSLAYTLRTDVVQAYTDQNGDWRDIAADWVVRPPNDSARQENAPLPEQLATHLAQGIIAFDRAIALDASMPEYYLSLGSLLEASMDRAGKIDVAPFVSGVEPCPELAWSPCVDQLTERGTYQDLLRFIQDARAPRASVRDDVVRKLLTLRTSENEAIRRAAASLLEEDWLAQTKECYFIAFALGLPRDSLRVEQPIRGVGSLITHEAGTAYLAMLRSPLPRSDEKLRWKIVRRVLDAFDDLPRTNSLTPILFPVDGHGAIAELVDTEVRVAFDLDGTGRPQSWPWVRPGAALLVWDPQGLGRITSGRQLFGSVSWWMFFDNGYLALDALDDNRDGELTGDELRGVRAWIDRDTDAISDPGEVVDLGALGIAAISTRPTTTDGECPMSTAGITRVDGSTLPTFDWIARAKRPEPSE